jgi:cyclic pyranopterin monophosphate synthase
MELTHINEQGRGQMVNVGDKSITSRAATAQAIIHMNELTYKAIMDKEVKKGDVLAVAQVAGIQAVKKTSELIPMAHPLFLTGINILFYPEVSNCSIRILCHVSCEGKTGVEMEALTGASVCALTIYDMAKALDPTMRITDIVLIEKKGGKSGHYVRNVL